MNVHAQGTCNLLSMKARYYYQGEELKQFWMSHSLDSECSNRDGSHILWVKGGLGPNKLYPHPISAGSQQEIINSVCPLDVTSMKGIELDMGQ